jgi:hypothetical protein
MPLQLNTLLAPALNFMPLQLDTLSLDGTFPECPYPAHASMH